VASWTNTNGVSANGTPITTTGYYQGSCDAVNAFAANQPGAVVTQVPTTVTEAAPVS